MIVKEIRFYNVDATPREVKFGITPGGIAEVMAWYGAYYSGDRYSVFLDGKRVEKDQNGELVTPEIDGVLP